MTREEIIEKLEWFEGGYGFAGNVGLSAAWATEAPGPDKPDLKSIVALKGPADKYADEELEKLLKFSEEMTAGYDEIFRYRLGANLILFDKPEALDGKWMRKRLTWTQGPMYSDTLDEAIAVMRGE